MKQDKIFPGDPETPWIGTVVNQVMEEFKAVNPSYTRFYSNKTQRAALERMINQYGVDQLKAIIQFLPKTNGKMYAPTITTPIQLEDKIAALRAYCEKIRDGAQSNSKGKEIIGM